MKTMTKNQMRLFIIAQVSAGNEFTIDIFGMAPSRGYMSGFKEAELIGANLTQSGIDLWITKNYLKLSTPNLFVGGWVEDGVYYLEMSKNMGDRAHALEFAERYDQKAIWDVKKGESIYLV